jgi:penicillin V acylase-like amidase (Ntn superfamily)
MHTYLGQLLSSRCLPKTENACSLPASPTLSKSRQGIEAMFRAIVAAASIAGTFNGALACTAVDFVASDSSVVAARTMEWAFDMQWTLISLPKGTSLAMTATPALKLPTVTVQSKYAVVGVKPGVIPGDTLLEGQNAVGLGMSGNFLPGFTQYQTVTPQDKAYVSILGFGAWALGQFATVAELRQALPGIKVWADDTLQSGPTPPTVHFIFTDRSGASIVVEFVNGQQHIFDNVAHVLTNAPTYDWHISNVRNYLNLSTVGAASLRIGETDVTAIGQGGGLVGIPGDYTPPSRFVRAAFLRHYATQPKNADEAVQLAVHILDTVDIPLGIAQSKEGNNVVSDYTQWVAIKDLTGNRLMISDYNHRTSYLTLDLHQIFAQDKPMSVAISALPYPKSVDATKALLK